MSEADAIDAGPGFARAGRLQIPEDLPHVNLRDAQRTGVDHLDLPHLDGLKNVSRDLVLTKPGEMTGASVVASWVDEWNDPKIREVAAAARAGAGTAVRRKFRRRARRE